MKLTKKAIQDRILRVWLRRIPEESGILHAYLVGSQTPDEPIGTATLYGRGWGSSANERTMLLFRLVHDTPSVSLTVGDVVSIRFEEEVDGQPTDYDILQVE